MSRFDLVLTDFADGAMPGDRDQIVWLHGMLTTRHCVTHVPAYE